MSVVKEEPQTGQRDRRHLRRHQMDQISSPQCCYSWHHLIIMVKAIEMNDIRTLYIAKPNLVRLSVKNKKKKTVSQSDFE